MPRLTPEQSEKLGHWIFANDSRLWIAGSRYLAATIEANDALHLHVSTGQFKRCQRRIFEEAHMPQKYFGFGGGLKRMPEPLTNCMWDRLQRALGSRAKSGKSLLGLTREMKEGNIASVDFSADSIRQAVHNHRASYGVDWDDPKAEDPTLIEFKDTQTPETAERKD